MALPLRNYIEKNIEKAKSLWELWLFMKKLLSYPYVDSPVDMNVLCRNYLDPAVGKWDKELMERAIQLEKKDEQLKDLGMKLTISQEHVKSYLKEIKVLKAEVATLKKE